MGLGLPHYYLCGWYRIFQPRNFSMQNDFRMEPENSHRAQPWLYIAVPCCSMLFYCCYMLVSYIYNGRLHYIAFHVNAYSILRSHTMLPKHQESTYPTKVIEPAILTWAMMINQVYKPLILRISDSGTNPNLIHWKQYPLKINPLVACSLLLFLNVDQTGSNYKLKLGKNVQEE